MVAVIQSLVDWLGGLWDFVDMLMYSPFRRVTVVIRDTQVLRMINWVLPISECVALAEAWGLATAGFYAVRTALRWIKIAE